MKNKWGWGPTSFELMVIYSRRMERTLERADKGKDENLNLVGVVCLRIIT